MVGSGSRSNVVLTSWKSARLGKDRQWSGSQYDKVLLLNFVVLVVTVATIYSWWISVVCGIGNIMGLSYPAWGHLWTACGHSWTAYGWSWRSDQYNHSKLSNWCDFYVSICFKICIYICVLCLYFNDMSILMSWGRQYLVNRVNEKDPKLQLWQMGVRI